MNHYRHGRFQERNISWNWNGCQSIRLYLAVIILTGTSRRGGLSGINAMIPVAFPTAKSLPAACMIRSKFFGICGAG